MKSLNFKLFLPFFILFFCILSCAKRKEEPTILPVIGPKLHKEVQYFLDIGAKFTLLELSYDTYGRVKSEKTDYANFIAEYNSVGIMTSITRTNTDGTIMRYALTYNSSGKMIRKMITETVAGVTKTSLTSYGYNANGRLSNITEPGELLTEISWDGDNISEMKVSIAGKFSSSIENPIYDDKVGPYYNIRDFMLATHNSVVSKNNMVSQKRNTAAGEMNSFFAYAYNPDGSVNSITNPSSGVMVKYDYLP